MPRELTVVHLHKRLRLKVKSNLAKIRRVGLIAFQLLSLINCAQIASGTF